MPAVGRGWMRCGCPAEWRGLAARPTRPCCTPSLCAAGLRGAERGIPVAGLQGRVHRQARVPAWRSLTAQALPSCLSSLRRTPTLPRPSLPPADEVFRHAAASFVAPESAVPYLGRAGHACTALTAAPPGAVRADSRHGFVRVGDGTAALMDAVASQG